MFKCWWQWWLNRAANNSMALFSCVCSCALTTLYTRPTVSVESRLLCWGLLMSSAFGRTLSPWLYICAYCSFSIADSANHDTAAGVKHKHTHAHIKNTRVPFRQFLASETRILPRYYVRRTLAQVCVCTWAGWSCLVLVEYLSKFVRPLHFTWAWKNLMECVCVCVAVRSSWWWRSWKLWTCQRRMPTASLTPTWRSTYCQTGRRNSRPRWLPLPRLSHSNCLYAVERNKKKPSNVSLSGLPVSCPPRGIITVSLM